MFAGVEKLSIFWARLSWKIPGPHEKDADYRGLKQPTKNGNDEHYTKSSLLKIIDFHCGEILLSSFMATHAPLHTMVSKISEF